MDGTDATGARLRGWGRYARHLLEALRGLTGVEAVALANRWPGPEAVWEQTGLPLAARRAGAHVLHAPNCFLPLVRPCAGVVTVHDLAFEALPDDFSRRTGAKFRWLTPRAARSAQRVICDSGFTRDDLCARYGVDPAKVRVIPLAPSLPLGDAPAPRGPYLLGVGDLRAKKNWRRLAEAWRSARLPHRLVIAGADAGEGAALRALGVELTGWVGDRELDGLMRGADAVVHPSLYEGYGLVVVEAMARGVPVAAARGTSLPEAGGSAAVYFDPLDVEDMAAAIRATLDRRGELAAAGHAHVAGLSWERTAALTAEVYREAAAC